MPAKNTYETTVQDFSGGLSLVDNELNLDPKYSVELNNIGRDNDGSLRPRYGYRLVYDGKDGSEAQVDAVITLNFTSGSTFVTGSFSPSNLLSNGGHIEFLTANSITAVEAYQIKRKFGVLVPNGIGGGANTFSFHLRSPATSTQTVSVTQTIICDTHTMSGNAVQSLYFQDYAIIFDDVGEVVAVNRLGIGTKLWSFAILYSQTPSPATVSGWRYTEYVNYDVFSSTLLAGNGADYPIAIDMTAVVKCQYHYDPATGSNAAIPKAGLLKSSSGYVVMLEPTSPAIAKISAKNTSSVFTGNADPQDAVDVDITHVTTAINPEIRAMTSLRSKLFMAFEDTSVLADLGLYTGTTTTIHEPNFSDVMTQTGCVSQRTCISLGNDILMLDYSGVPSISISATSGAYIPSRVSDLIEPVLQKHISRLTESTLVRKAFAVWNFRARQYMLFLPKYDDSDIRTCEDNPIFVLDDMLNKNEVGIYYNSHALEANDYVNVSGVTGTIGSISASAVNGKRKIVRVINANTFVVETDTPSTITDSDAGGSAVTIQPVNDETTGYIYHFNPALRIKAWCIYHNLNFTSGFRSLLGDVFFTAGAKLYKFGSAADPIYTDKQLDYDYRTWSSGFSYNVGDRVRDGLYSYQCAVAHTSSGASFSAERSTHPEYWNVYGGEAINWSWELPWADFAKRWKEKVLRYFSPNALGSGRMNVQFFTDQIKYDPLTRAYAPAREMAFVAADTGGFGNEGDQTYGGGRRTREEVLWYLPLRAKLLKLRLTGAAAEPLRIVGLSFIYQLGGYR